MIKIEGKPADGIAELAADRHTDLIVMSSRRKSTVRALLGSTAETVTRSAPCPVLVIHPDEREWVGKTMCEIDIHRILIAHDFSNCSELALKYALALAHKFRAELHLLYVFPVTPESVIATFTGSIEADIQGAARLLQQAVPGEARLWCQINQAVKSGLPDEEILAYSDERDIDLICMGVHGAGFMRRAIFGSNADSVLRQAKRPVLIAKPVSKNVSGNVLEGHGKILACSGDWYKKIRAFRSCQAKSMLKLLL